MCKVVQLSHTRFFSWWKTLYWELRDIGLFNYKSHLWTCCDCVWGNAESRHVKEPCRNVGLTSQNCNSIAIILLSNSCSCSTNAWIRAMNTKIEMRHTCKCWQSRLAISTFCRPTPLPCLPPTCWGQLNIAGRAWNRYWPQTWLLFWLLCHPSPNHQRHNEAMDWLLALCSVLMSTYRCTSKSNCWIWHCWHVIWKALSTKGCALVEKAWHDSVSNCRMMEWETVLILCKESEIRKWRQVIDLLHHHQGNHSDSHRLATHIWRVASLGWCSEHAYPCDRHVCPPHSHWPNTLVA